MNIYLSESPKTILFCSIVMPRLGDDDDIFIIILLYKSCSPEAELVQVKGIDNFSYNVKYSKTCMHI